MLSGANLSGTNLVGTNLSGANLNEALQLHLFRGMWSWSQFEV
jgi:uncharacterized protein YjbI with pentapeptide repeats